MRANCVSHHAIEHLRGDYTVPHHIDGKRWAALRSLYADEVETDYTSLFGGEPHKQSADALVAGWRGVLERVRSI